ncbi:unnamed protein product, partial [marine sediment metagenome]
GAERVTRILTKAMLGEREGLIELGIKISEDEVKARLLEKGLDKLTGTALRQAKADVTLELATEMSAKAIGDFERTSESAANMQRILKERIKELSETLGVIFVPVLEAVLGKIMPVIEKMGEWVEKNPELVRTIIIVAGAIAALVAGIGVLGLILPSILTGFAAVFSPIGLIIIGVTVLIGGLIAYFVKMWQTNEKFRNKMIEAWDSIKASFEKAKSMALEFWDTLKRLWSIAVEFLTPAFESLKGSLGELWDKLKELWDIVSPLLLPA